MGEGGRILEGDGGRYVLSLFLFLVTRGKELIDVSREQSKPPLLYS